MHRLLPALGIAVAGGLAALVALGTPISRASTADAPCPPDVLAGLTDISRSIVPIGVEVSRGFRLSATTDATFSDVHLSAPPEYSAQQIPANQAYALRFTAPHAGSFSVQATWTETYDANGNGTLTSCTGTGTSMLTAAKGSPLVVSPPAAQKFPAADHIKGTQYDTPAVWTWKCQADSDPTPLKVTVRWEVDPRAPPLFSKGGSAPFTFTKHAKEFTLTAGDSCDVRQSGSVEKRLPQNAKLKVLAGGDVVSGGGMLVIELRGGFRRSGNAIGGPEPLHLGITLAQGARKLLDTKICSWNQTAFLLARGKGVSCWW